MIGSPFVAAIGTMLVVAAATSPSPNRAVISNAPPAASCWWTPDEPVTMEIDDSQTFSSLTLPPTPPCTGYTAVIAPANGTIGFTQGSGCDQSSASGGAFKIRACQSGTATISILDSGSNVIQTIDVTVATP